MSHPPRSRRDRLRWNKLTHALHGNTLKVCVANPTSLRSKFTDTIALAADVYILSETHIGADHLKSTKRELRARDYVGHFALTPQPRTCGTAVIVKRPHTLQPIWTHPTGRAQLTQVRCGCVDFLCAAIYGDVHDLQHTVELLTELLQEISKYQHAAVLLGGDFNASANELFELQQLHEKGWARMHSPTTVTCVTPNSEGTAIDAVYASPAMLARLSNPLVDSSITCFSPHFPLFCDLHAAPQHLPQLARHKSFPKG
eukprot:4787320-Amphidinium_carterae.1